MVGWLGANRDKRGHIARRFRDLVGLITPRPMLVEAADYDPIFPIAAVRRSVARARKIYGLFGAADEVRTDYFEGRHQISGARAYDFLWEKLAY